MKKICGKKALIVGSLVYGKVIGHQVSEYPNFFDETVTVNTNGDVATVGIKDVVVFDKISFGVIKGTTTVCDAVIKGKHYVGYAVMSPREEVKDYKFARMLAFARAFYGQDVSEDELKEELVGDEGKEEDEVKEDKDEDELYCHHCGQRIDVEDEPLCPEDEDGNLICPECADKLYWSNPDFVGFCEDCGKAIYSGDNYYEDEDGTIYCSECSDKEDEADEDEADEVVC